MTAFVSWDDVPLVLDIRDAARVLNISTRTIRRRLARGEHVPGLMPRHGHEPWTFSKSTLQKFIEGGYALRVVRKRA